MTCSRREAIFLLIYPLGHLALVAAIFFLADLFPAPSTTSEVIFMAVLLLIAPVLAFPGSLKEIGAVFSEWHPAAVFLLVYLTVLIVYALPILVILKRRKH